MLIPRFRLTQNDDFVYIKVHCPYSKFEEAELYVEGFDLVFSAPPYHLRLRLTGQVLEEGRSQAKWIVDENVYEMAFEKATPGEHFPHLDTIANLLVPKDMPDVNPDLIQVIGGEGDEDQGPSRFETVKESPWDGVLAYTNKKFSYGFANRINRPFANEFSGVFEVRSPEEMSYEDRKALMEEYERDKFSSDHYLADYFDLELIDPVIQYVAPWEKATPDEYDFTDEDLDVLKNLPNKEYLLTQDEFEKVTYNLVDIIYAYCYEKRVTFNENNVESSWTINRVSGTLSWFAVYNSLEDTLVSCYRRSLVYPIYRNFDLSAKVQKDVEHLLSSGRKCVVKALIEIFRLFNQSLDARYILNQLYIKDFLVFSQKCPEETYRDLYDRLRDITITKACLKLDLEEYESAGKMVQTEESQIIENATALMSNLNVSPDEGRGSPPVKTVSGVDWSADWTESSSESDSSSDSSSELDSDDDSSSE